MKIHSEASQRRIKFLLILPLLVLPFLILTFWALGGGSATAPRAPLADTGLNLQLPGPLLNREESPNKLSLYQQARRRLQKQDEAGKVYLQQLGLSDRTVTQGEDTLSSPNLNSTAAASVKNRKDFHLSNQPPAEEKISQRLAHLSQLVSQEVSPYSKEKAKETTTSYQLETGSRFSEDVDKLELMMHAMGSSKGATDPEMRQLQELLERILDIQHPERVKESIRAQSAEEPLQKWIVQPVPQGPPITTLQRIGATLHTGSKVAPLPLPEAKLPPPGAPNIFYSQQGDQGLGVKTEEAIETVVHETQTLTSGAVVKLRLLQDVSLNNKKLHKGMLLYGICQLKGERLEIRLTSIRLGNTILPASLQAYDLDGQLGLYLLKNSDREAARNSTNQVINQSLQFPSISPSLGAQAAGTVMEAAKGLLNRREKQVKVTVKAGHRLLLRG